MDPYPESPRVWPGVHHPLASGIRGEPDRVLPRPCCVKRGIRPEVGIVDHPVPTGQLARGLKKAASTLVLDASGRPIRTRVLRHERGSVLARAVGSDAQFRAFADEIRKRFGDELAAQAAAGRVDLDAVDLTASLKARPSYPPWRKPTALARIIGGFQGAALQLSNFRLGSPSGPIAPGSTVDYAADLVLVLADDFGVDYKDMRTADYGMVLDRTGAQGLRAQWVLQHQRRPRPFVNEVVVLRTLTGSFHVPSGFDRIEDRTT